LQAVILAAGTGSRLGALTESIPKALIPVAGIPLLSYAIAFARNAGAEKTIVVTGKFKEKVEAHLSELGQSNLTWVHNSRFLLGNLYSLGAARPHIQGDFLLLNTDHVYGKPVAARVREKTIGITAFCDHDRKLGADDMKVELSPDGRLKRISKTLTKFEVGYVGMTFCSASEQKTYFESFDRVESRVGEKAVVEMILADLADRGLSPGIGDISEIGWLEIDTPEERQRAEAEILGNRDRYPFISR
jgi:choline kinase